MKQGMELSRELPDAYATPEGTDQFSFGFVEIGG